MMSRAVIVVGLVTMQIGFAVGAARAAIMTPCQGVRYGVARMGEEQWLRYCMRALSADDPLRAMGACRAWIARCTRDPRGGLPPGINNL